jgi:hypothetical protein
MVGVKVAGSVEVEVRVGGNVKVTLAVGVGVSGSGVWVGVADEVTVGVTVGVAINPGRTVTPKARRRMIPMITIKTAYLRSGGIDFTTGVTFGGSPVNSGSGEESV